MSPVKPRRVVFLLLVLTIVTWMNFTQLQTHVFSKVYYYFHPQESIRCYRTKGPTLPQVEDDSDEFPRPPADRSIFFHETSCNSFFSDGKITIDARQACAVESAAKMNPNSRIYLLYASPGVLKLGDGEMSDRFLDALMSYENVHIRHVDYERYSKGSPVEELYKGGRIEGSGYAQSHASDVLRYLTLWKFGGIYLDLDVIVKKSLEHLPPNYAGSESDRNVAAGVLSFASGNIGQTLVQHCLSDLKDNFSGRDWGYNGPGVITRLLKKLCGVEQAKDMLKRGTCGGFQVFPPSYFYPISWWNWTMYFEEDLNNSEKVMAMCKDSYVVHVWNKHSFGRKVRVDGHSPYAVYARRFCPKVVAECGEFL